MRVEELQLHELYAAQFKEQRLIECAQGNFLIDKDEEILFRLYRNNLADIILRCQDKIITIVTSRQTLS